MYSIEIEDKAPWCIRAKEGTVEGKKTLLSPFTAVQGVLALLKLLNGGNMRSHSCIKTRPSQAVKLVALWMVSNCEENWNHTSDPSFDEYDMRFIALWKRKRKSSFCQIWMYSQPVIKSGQIQIFLPHPFKSKSIGDVGHLCSCLYHVLVPCLDLALLCV